MDVSLSLQYLFLISIQLQLIFQRLQNSAQDSAQDSSFINTHIVSSLSEVFSESPEEYSPWLVKCSKSYELSKTVFILVLQQSCASLKNGIVALTSTCLICLSMPLLCVFDILHNIFHIFATLSFDLFLY